MARSNRQTKILEIILNNDISSQDELVSRLRMANFDVTQATISRDIKELGLIKLLQSDGRYKYALMENKEQIISNKNVGIMRELILSINTACNLCVIKTLGNFASSISAMLEKLNIENTMGTVFGTDTIMLITKDNATATKVQKAVQDIIG